MKASRINFKNAHVAEDLDSVFKKRRELLLDRCQQLNRSAVVKKMPMEKILLNLAPGPFQFCEIPEVSIIISVKSRNMFVQLPFVVSCFHKREEDHCVIHVNLATSNICLSARNL